MLEAVLPVAGLAVDGDGGEGVDEGFARWIGALFPCERRWLLACKSGGDGGGVGFPSCGGPFTGVSAFVSGFGAVVHAEAAFAGLTSERE